VLRQNVLEQCFVDQLRQPRLLLLALQLPLPLVVQSVHVLVLEFFVQVGYHFEILRKIDLFYLSFKLLSRLNPSLLIL
jgi:hypothetical protein